MYGSFVCTYVCTMCMPGTLRDQEGIISPQTEVTDDCELTCVSGTEPRTCLPRTGSALNCRAISPVPTLVS